MSRGGLIPRGVMALMALVAGAALVVLPADARAEGDPRRAEAAERFDRGMALLEEGDNAGALAELSRVYEIAPHPQVLYNLGLVHAALNRPVEAVRALDQVLAAPGVLPADRVARARLTRDQEARRVGLLEVTTNVPAVLESDGIAAGTTPLARPLPLSAGTHVVSALAPGYLPVRKEITIAGQTRAALHLALAPSELRLAHLSIRTPLPGAEVFVDGQPVGRTPLPGTLAVAPGKRAVELRRAGYRAARQEIALDDGAAGELAFDLPEDDAAAVPAGRLVLAVSEPDPDVIVDGRPRGAYRGPLALPPGVHAVRVARAGFLPADRTVLVPEGGGAEARVTLIPTPETRAAYKHRAEVRRTGGWVSALGGAALAGGAAVLVARNRAPLADARARLAGLKGPCDGATDRPAQMMCDQDGKAAAAEVNKRDTIQVAGIIAAALGVAALGTGIVLVVGGDDPDRYDRVPRDPDRLAAAAGVAFQPWLSPGAAGGGVILSGGF